MIGSDLPNLTAKAVMPGGNIETISYEDYAVEGQYHLLFFYHADFTWVCPTELRELKNRIEEFGTLRTSVWAISTDGVEVHAKWIQEAFENFLPYALVSDRNWDMSAYFGCLNEDEGVSYRCTVIIDGEGKIRHYSVNDNNVGRDINDILRLIAAFQDSDATGMVAQCGWTPGEEMITPGE